MEDATLFPMRLILDRHRRLGDFTKTTVSYDTSIRKEEAAREIVLARQGRFLDIGAGDGDLMYLLGIEANFETEPGMLDRNRAEFDRRYSYHALDLEPRAGATAGDICSDNLLDELDDWAASFDVVYSNNVFEHLRRPWVAARNVVGLLKPGGIAITVTQFAIRYHAVPHDYFRYSHEGIAALFEDAGAKVIRCGYDLTGRRNNWQGRGTADDIVPVDEFGAWRENWFVFCAAERP